MLQWPDSSSQTELNTATGIPGIFFIFFMISNQTSFISSQVMITPSLYKSRQLYWICKKSFFVLAATLRDTKISETLQNALYNRKNYKRQCVWLYNISLITKNLTKKKVEANAKCGIFYTSFFLLTATQSDYLFYLDDLHTSKVSPEVQVIHSQIKWCLSIRQGLLDIREHILSKYEIVNENLKSSSDLALVIHQQLTDLVTRISPIWV